MTKHVPEDLFRRRALASFSAPEHGRPIAIMPRPWLWLAGASSAFMVFVVCFICTTQYARKETVRGWLVSREGVVRISHGVPAAVSKIARAAGDAVKRGEPILFLTTATNLENGSTSARETLDRLRDDLLETTRREKITHEQFARDNNGLDRQIQGIDAEILALSLQSDEQRTRIRLSLEKLQRLESGLDRGAVTRLDVLHHQDALAALQQSLGRLLQESNRLARERQQLVAAQERTATDLQLNLSSIASARIELQQRITRHERERSFVLQSPIDGTLATLDVVAGSSVRPQQVLATILPERLALTADVYVPSRAVGLIEPGQAVRLIYDAFPFHQFGAASGRIRSIAGFVSLPEDIPPVFGVREAAYKVRVDVDADHVVGRRGRYALRPGMSLAAEIVLEKRSLLHWLLAPLHARF
jgi:membrane fusion protein